MRAMQISVPSRFRGPPRMGHGGYVAGLLAEQLSGPVQVTLRKPTPLDRPLELRSIEGSALALLDGEVVIAEAAKATWELSVPAPPTLAQAVAAEAGSPSHYGEQGVHPVCFGCGRLREPGDALRIFVGPCEVEGQPIVAARFVPDPSLCDASGALAPRYAIAALDCPGAFAFIARGTRAGLLGRIAFTQFAQLPGDRPAIVIGWQIGSEGRKLYAGTALFDEHGHLCAAAKATWFQPG
jgi:hypothetical protein